MQRVKERKKRKSGKRKVEEAGRKRKEKVMEKEEGKRLRGLKMGVRAL